MTEWCSVLTCYVLLTNSSICFLWKRGRTKLFKTFSQWQLICWIIWKPHIINVKKLIFNLVVQISKYLIKIQYINFVTITKKLYILYNFLKHASNQQFCSPHIVTNSTYFTHSNKSTKFCLPLLLLLKHFYPLKPNSDQRQICSPHITPL